jgi:hypothetical protein
MPASMPRHQRNAYGTERAAEGHKWRGIQGPDQVPPSQLLRPKLLLRYRSILRLAILRTRPYRVLWARSRAVAVWRNITANAENADCRQSHTHATVRTNPPMAPGC